MENLYYILILVIAGCGVSDSGSEDSIYPIQKGAYEIQSLEKAVYTGYGGAVQSYKASAASVDTILVADTTGHQLHIRHANDPDVPQRFDIYFHDENMMIDLVAGLIHVEDSFPYTYPCSSGFSVSGRSIRQEADGSGRIIFKAGYWCYGPDDFIDPFTDDVIFSMYQDGVHVNSYRFYGDGFEDTVRHIMCAD